MAHRWRRKSAPLKPVPYREKSMAQWRPLLFSQWRTDGASAHTGKATRIPSAAFPIGHLGLASASAQCFRPTP